MSLLFRAAVLGAVAYLITRSLSQNSRAGSWRSEQSDQALPDAGQRNLWPTSEDQTSAAHAAPPTS